MISRILSKPIINRKSFFLFGPRGTGKTSWLKSQLKECVYLDLLNTEIYSALLANPHRLQDFIPKGYSNWIILDEIQRVPELLNEVHRLIEEQQHVFALTGSSARKLRKKGTNLLAGRALTYHMHPLTAQEMGNQFDLKQALAYGMLPGLLSEPDSKKYLQSYVGIYLREEVLQEGLTRNLSAFSRFLEAASFSQGQVLNMANIARETYNQHANIRNYFSILEDLLIGCYLPIFTKRAKRQTVQHPKFYFFDTGVYQILRPRGLLDMQREIEGAALETLFLQSLRAINDYFELDYKLYYWRTVAGVEVDFIVYGPQGFFAFEIKRSATVSPIDTKGLLAFKEDYPEVTPYLIYCGGQNQYLNGVTILPITDALHQLPGLIGATCK